jgi:hypothetical protein
MEGIKSLEASDEQQTESCNEFVVQHGTIDCELVIKEPRAVNLHQNMLQLKTESNDFDYHRLIS